MPDPHKPTRGTGNGHWPAVLIQQDPFVQANCIVPTAHAFMGVIVQRYSNVEFCLNSDLNN